MEKRKTENEAEAEWDKLVAEMLENKVWCEVIRLPKTKIQKLKSQK